MKNLLLFFMCTFCFISFASAQVASSEKTAAEKEMDRVSFTNPYSTAHQYHYRSQKIRMDGGDEKFFINEKWMRSKIFDKEGNETILNQANYLVAKRIILFKKEGELFQVYPQAVKMVVLNNKIFKAYPSVDESNEGVSEFYEVPAAGFLELISVWDLKEQPLTNNPMGIQDGNRIEITQTSKLYYKKGKQRKLKRLPKKKDDRYAIFGGKRRTVLEYAKKHNLSIKKQDDLVNLFTYYNSLVSLEEKGEN